MPEVQLKAPSLWQRAKFMPELYQRLVVFIAGEIVSFKAGYGFYDQDSEEPLLPLPDEMDDIPAVFYEGRPEIEISQGQILVKCVVPSGAVSNPTRYSLIGLCGKNGEPLAVAQFLMEWVTPEEINTQYCYLKFPNYIEQVNP